MDISPLALTGTLIPQIPNILKVIVLAILHLSATAGYQDIVTQILVAIIRPILGTPKCLELSQQQTTKDLPIIGPIWVSKVRLPKPDDGELEIGEREEGICGVREAIVKAIKVLGDGRETYTMPAVQDVEGEWNAYRSKASWFARRPKVSEKEQYELMMEDVRSDGPTILYFHGGAFCLMDPSTHRIFTTRLACLSSGRCFSVRFRLAPQGSFPAPLLDALIAYLSLIAPPPHSFHRPVPASSIVLAGDSSGGALATSLMLLLLTLRHRMGITHLVFHSHLVPISLPAGLATTHPYLDVARSLPSIHGNAAFDIITPPGNYPSPLFPRDSVWPSNPPRVETYCNATAVIHPLVSPIAALASDWTKCPPVYVGLGYEGLEDEISVWARRVYQAGTTVLFDGYVGMPHCFVFLLPWTLVSRRCFKNWAAFCKEAVRAQRGLASISDGKSFMSKNRQEDMAILRRDYGTWTTRHGQVQRVKLDDLAMKEGNGRLVCDDKIVQRLLEKQRDWRIELEEEHLQDWNRIQKEGGVFEVKIPRIGLRQVTTSFDLPLDKSALRMRPTLGIEEGSNG